MRFGFFEVWVETWSDEEEEWEACDEYGEYVEAEPNMVYRIGVICHDPDNSYHVHVTNIDGERVFSATDGTATYGESVYAHGIQFNESGSCFDADFRFAPVLLEPEARGSSGAGVSMAQRETGKPNFGSIVVTFSNTASCVKKEDYMSYKPAAHLPNDKMELTTRKMTEKELLKQGLGTIQANAPTEAFDFPCTLLLSFEPAIEVRLRYTDSIGLTLLKIKPASAGVKRRRHTTAAHSSDSSDMESENEIIDLTTSTWMPPMPPQASSKYVREVNMASAWGPAPTHDDVLQKFTVAVNDGKFEGTPMELPIGTVPSNAGLDALKLHCYHYIIKFSTWPLHQHFKRPYILTFVTLWTYDGVEITDTATLNAATNIVVAFNHEPFIKAAVLG